MYSKSLEIVSNNTIIDILNKFSARTISKENYEKIAFLFTKNLSEIDSENLRSILKIFVDYSGTPIYVNEVKNLLKNDSEMFKKYGDRFVNFRGVKEAFGIECENPIDFTFESVIRTEVSNVRSPREKTYIRKKRVKKNIKKEARNQAIERYQKKVDMTKDRKKKLLELDKMIKKANS